MILSGIRQKWGAFRWYLVLLGLLVGAAYLGWLYAGYDFNYLQKKVQSQQNTLDNLIAENEKLTKQLNILRVELDVASLSQQKSFEEIKQSIEREKALQKDIAFYQQVMAPELTQQGFVIDAFNVEKTLSDRSYRFEVVMMQRDKIKNTLKGTLDITLVGSENGQSKQYVLSDLLVDAGQKLVFGFKYFQVMDGEVQLPENFQPERVLIHAVIYQFNTKKGELHSSFDWQVTNTNS